MFCSSLSGTGAPAAVVSFLSICLSSFELVKKTVTNYEPIPPFQFAQLPPTALADARHSSGIHKSTTLNRKRAAERRRRGGSIAKADSPAQDTRPMRLMIAGGAAIFALPFLTFWVRYALRQSSEEPRPAATQ